MESKYNARHAQEILEPCGVLGELVLLDDRGVWPAVDRDILMQVETEGLRWQPADELQYLPGAPDVIDTPMLPLPFTARELAAFMLAGSGALVSGFYGDWRNGPDPESLNHIDPKSSARRAVVEAYAAHRLAKEEVGSLDASFEKDADIARRKYNEARQPKDGDEQSGKESLKDLDEEMERTAALAKTAYETWLNSMVRELLAPDNTQSKTEPQADTPPAPVVEAPASEPIRYHLLATRAQLCAVFGVWGLSLGMFKNLTERQWLMDARKVKGQGQRGNIVEPLFCPFQVMRGLATKTKKPKFSEEKGWDILENRFKAVFEEYQQFDTREQAG